MDLTKNPTASIYKSIPIILGGGINGLGVVRSFGEEGIHSFVFEEYPDVALYSRYSTGLICPSPIGDNRSFIKFLMNFGRRLKYKGFLIATSDKFLISISKNQELLEEYYCFPTSRWSTLENLINKEKLYALAETIGIKKPRTYEVRNTQNIERITEQLGFPVIIKPSVTIGFTEVFGKKVLIINSKQELLSFGAKLSTTIFSEKPLIIQEFIPGSVENLYTITSYTNRNHEIISYSIGHKIRQDPPFAGTITSGRIDNVPQILYLSRKLVKSAKFYGISNIEFKKDERDGQYKLMEINPRSGVWNYSVKASGINLPLILYKDYFGESFCKTNKSKNITWVSLIDDLSLSLVGFKRMGYPQESLTFWQWLKSIRGKKTFAILNFMDLKPFIKKIQYKVTRKFSH